MANDIYFHAEAHALTGKLNKPFEEQIKEQAFVKLEGHSQELLVKGEELRRLKERKAQKNYLSQHTKNFRLEGIISYSAAYTQVSGHRSKRDPDRLVTLATSSVENLNILNVVTVDRVVAQVSTTHFPCQYAPEVTFLGTHFENLRIAGHKTEPVLKLDFAGKRPEGKRAVYPVKGTGLMASAEKLYAKLRADFKEVKADLEPEYLRRLEAEDSWFSKQYHKFSDFNYQALQKSAEEGLGQTAKGNPWDRVTCSLVEHVEIEDIAIERKDADPIVIPHPAHSFGHVIYVPDFGTIFLGELKVNHNSFHLTMIRLELGCIADGNVSIVTCSVNGRGVGGNGGGNGRDLAGDAADRILLTTSPEPGPEEGGRGSEIDRREAERREAQRFDVPADLSVDNVLFTLTGQQILRPAEAHELWFWVHLEKQKAAVLEGASEVLNLPISEISVKSQGPYPLRRGSRLSVRLKIDGLKCSDCHKWITWTGEVGKCAFVVEVPKNAAEGTHRGRASIRLEGCEIATMSFVVMVGQPKAGVGEIPAQTTMHRSAFASYASEDRAQVLSIIQGMEKAARGLEVFVDVAKIRSGQDWEQELRKAVGRADVFYLFWCRHARDSEWVGKEWQWALKEKGVDFIDPVPLEGPELAEPPKELDAKHFNDPLVAFIAAAGGGHARGAA